MLSSGFVVMGSHLFKTDTTLSILLLWFCAEHLYSQKSFSGLVGASADIE
jgi:hypothetical protein